jgi:EAL domain-containing protein (putative c-di-GMP-specific phosphodiesterase class I)/CheY-like chemotaxis protein
MDQLVADREVSERMISNLRFLVVEDHEFQRHALVRLLDGLGARAVQEARDGYAALEIIRQSANPIDIVITDLDMPRMDGMQLVRHLGEDQIHTSIILASALERALIGSIATMAREYGVRLLGVVEKPVMFGQLQALIKMHYAKPLQDRRKTPRPSLPLEDIGDGLRNDQFEPFFQPKVDLASGEVRGAEALARWRHPQLGIIPPIAFIPALESSGLIDPLTWAVLAKSAAACKRFREAGLDMNVAVNLSLRSLGDVHLADRVTEIVRAQGLEPRHMVLEITESAATTDVAHALENLSRLRMKGFGLSIDDYGTGYSSMQQLTRIAFTELKIDQSFVMNASVQESSAVILESCLDMAKRLRIKAVAEGVETREDYELLRRLGCDLAQGYLIARPMEADSYLAWAKDWKGLIAVR